MKNGKNKQSNLIASVKILNIGVINKYTINLGIGGGGYPVLVNYQSFPSNLFSLALPPPQLVFFTNCRRNRLLHVSFIELYGFIIYQHVNKRTKILPLATSQITHLCNNFNHVYTAIFYASFLKHYFFYQNSSKIVIFAKNAKFSSAGGSAPRSVA